jgi:hypothetical protein
VAGGQVGTPINSLIRPGLTVADCLPWRNCNGRWPAGHELHAVFSAGITLIEVTSTREWLQSVWGCSIDFPDRLSHLPPAAVPARARLALRALVFVALGVGGRVYLAGESAQGAAGVGPVPAAAAIVRPTMPVIARPARIDSESVTVDAAGDTAQLT